MSYIYKLVKMWSKGAKNDYLDTYDEDNYDDEYYEEDDKNENENENKNKEELKVEEKIKTPSISESETESETESESESEDDDYTVNESIIYKDEDDYELYNDELIFDNYTTFICNNNLNEYNKYKEINSPKNIIKRFGFKRLKSNDNNFYYLDSTLYFIWKYFKNSKTGEEYLVRPDDEIYKKIRAINTNHIFYDRYLNQPQIYY
jgi:hypothetical protein